MATDVQRVYLDPVSWERQTKPLKNGRLPAEENLISL
jgi:hypothetical protein